MPTTTRRCSAGREGRTPSATARRSRNKPHGAWSGRSAPGSPKRSPISSTGWRSNVRKRVKASPHSIGVQLLAVALVLLATALVAFGFKEAGDPRLGFAGLIVSGEARTPVANILYAAGFAKGTNVWLLDTAAARRRIEALPW